MNKTITLLFKVPTSNIYIQLFRYLFAGGLAFVVDVSVLYCLTEYVGLYYLLSSVIGFVIGLIITYVLSVVWIFDERRTEHRLLEMMVFSLIGGVGIALTSLFMWGLYFGGNAALFVLKGADYYHRLWLELLSEKGYSFYEKETRLGVELDGMSLNEGAIGWIALIY